MKNRQLKRGWLTWVGQGLVQRAAQLNQTLRHCATQQQKWYPAYLNKAPDQRQPMLPLRVRQFGIGLVLLMAAAFSQGVSAIGVTATPNSSPATVQSGGGNVDLGIAIDNTDPVSQAVDLWTVLTYPDGTTTVTPVDDPQTVTLPAGWNAGGSRTVTLDATDPEGIYTHTTYIGSYPSGVLGSSSFTIEKVPQPPPSGGGGWYMQNSGTTRVLLDIHFADNANGWAVGAPNVLLHTSDGGDNWYPQVSPTSSNYYGVQFINSLTGWAAGSAGKLIHTSDGGANWTVLNTGTNRPFYGLYFLDANRGWLVGGVQPAFSSPYSYIYGTTDGGNSWQLQYYGAGKFPLKKIQFSNKEVGWAVGELGQVLRTTDGGKSWTPMDVGTGNHLNDLYFVDESEGWIAGRDGLLFYTRNKGESWQQLNTGTTENLTRIHFADRQNGWMTTSTGTGGRILETVDGGRSWQEQAFMPPNGFNSLYFTDGLNGWATDYRGGIFHTTSGGR